MSIATAIGLIRVYEDGLDEFKKDPIFTVYDSYLEWKISQDTPSNRRGPGITCLTWVDGINVF